MSGTEVGIRSGRVKPDELVVPGVVGLLASLQQRSVTCYLASGTDEKAVIDETNLLGLTNFFDGRIFGARDDGQTISKKMLIDQILDEHRLSSYELVVFGDGSVEIQNAATVGSRAVGVASNEVERQGINEAKRQQLIQAGADLIIPDFREHKVLLEYLTGGS
jgi:phosphoglycolate phosphatase